MPDQLASLQFALRHFIYYATLHDCADDPLFGYGLRGLREAIAAMEGDMRGDEQERDGIQPEGGN